MRKLGHVALGLVLAAAAAVTPSDLIAQDRCSTFCTPDSYRVVGPEEVLEGIEAAPELSSWRYRLVHTDESGLETDVPVIAWQLFDDDRVIYRGGIGDDGMLTVFDSPRTGDVAIAAFFNDTGTNMMTKDLVVRVVRRDIKLRGLKLQGPGTVRPDSTYQFTLTPDFRGASRSRVPAGVELEWWLESAPIGAELSQDGLLTLTCGMDGQTGVNVRMSYEGITLTETRFPYIYPSQGVSSFPGIYSGPGQLIGLVDEGGTVQISSVAVDMSTADGIDVQTLDPQDVDWSSSEDG